MKLNYYSLFFYSALKREFFFETPGITDDKFTFKASKFICRSYGRFIIFVIFINRCVRVCFLLIIAYTIVHIICWLQLI